MAMTLRARMIKSSQIAVVLILGAGLAGCAATASEDPTGMNDPYESTNRAVFTFNMKLDDHVALPIAKFYNRVVSEKGRDRVHNFLVNLSLPVTFGNDILQGQIKRAGQTLGRFGVNSTLGLAGLMDVASQMGIPNHTEDFGQTLGTYGVGEGPYLVLPLIGPAPPRDLIGNIIDSFLDPFTYVGMSDKFLWSAGRTTGNIVDERSGNIDTIENIKLTSTDYYATVRSLYRQYRNAEIHNGKPDIQDLPEY